MILNSLRQNASPSLIVHFKGNRIPTQYGDQTFVPQFGQIPFRNFLPSKIESYTMEHICEIYWFDPICGTVHGRGPGKTSGIFLMTYREFILFEAY